MRCHVDHLQPRVESKTTTQSIGAQESLRMIIILIEVPITLSDPTEILEAYPGADSNVPEPTDPAGGGTPETKTNTNDSMGTRYNGENGTGADQVPNTPIRLATQGLLLGKLKLSLIPREIVIRQTDHIITCFVYSCRLSSIIWSTP